MSRYDSNNFPRRFLIGSVYRSTLGYPLGEGEEVMFVVLEVKTYAFLGRAFGNEPAEYWALDLSTGEKFGFHRASRLAEEAVLVG